MSKLTSFSIRDEIFNNFSSSNLFPVSCNPIGRLVIERAKGMDIIIGVDVQDGLANRTDLSSAPEILFQINKFRTINDMKIKSKKTDIYIKPDITSFTIVSFDDGRKIIKEGEKAAIHNSFSLDKLPKIDSNKV